ncbi:CC149-like protein [Mya arenaria]|uniref:CC149-like protein n=1 Tax=Mya arenaria TaxID=6604 RepID=A0ABY7FLR9_MYAAR|nr:CC149-like protein [Mya arenaria]
MSRKRGEYAAVKISDEEYNRLEAKLEAVKNEFSACRRKLESKCEALLILSQELDGCRSERDQYKLMAEQLRERYQSLKKGLTKQPLQSSSDTAISKCYTDTQSQNLARLLYESQENRKSLKFEVDDLKQKLIDAQGDIRLLREQIARQRVGTTDEGMNTRIFPAHEREQLVQKLESSNEKYVQLERDLQTVLDEKEELVTARDVYRNKYERLNTELTYILKGDENRLLDIDALIMENKYLQERQHQMEDEKTMAMQTVSKYKSLLEKKKTKSSLKFGTSRGGGMIISQKQVQEVLESRSSVVPSVKALTDLQALAGALLDSVNDKNLALSHQRKTNKILGNRVAELDKKIKTLECAGLWSIPGGSMGSLERLRQDLADFKTEIIPHSDSDSDRLSTSDRDSELETVTPLDSTLTSPLTSPVHARHMSGPREHSDLDLLPTKDTCNTLTNGQETQSVSDCVDIPSLPRPPDKQRPKQSVAAGLGEKHDMINTPSHNTPSQHMPLHDSLHMGQGDGMFMENGGDSFSASYSEVQVYADDHNIEDNANDPDCDVNDQNGDEEFDAKETLRETESDNLEHFYDNDEEDSETVGLLLEKVAKKMCNISHNPTNRDTSVQHLRSQGGLEERHDGYTGNVRARNASGDSMGGSMEVECPTGDSESMSKQHDSVDETGGSHTYNVQC